MKTRVDGVDVLVDLSSVAPESLLRQEELEQSWASCQVGDSTPLVTTALPRRTEPGSAEPATILKLAIGRAVARRRHLLVLLQNVRPADDVIARLVEVFEIDPLFASAQPRFADEMGDRIWPLPAGHSDWPGPTTSLSILPFLPEHTLVPELLSVCLLIRWNLLAADDTIDEGYGTLRGALLDWLCRARRLGMLHVIANHAVLRTRLRWPAIYPPVPRVDAGRIQSACPDHPHAEFQITDLPQRRVEPLLSQARREGPKRVLLDIRSMAGRYDGTAKCVLGFLDGFKALHGTAHIDLLATPEAASFHQLAERYSDLGELYEEPTKDYFAAVCLTHPWSLYNVTELHRHALVIVFNMLDTIGWDVLYTNGGSAVGIVWRFVADYADALVYNSHFSRMRFNMRFPTDPRVLQDVTHHSVARDEYVFDNVLDAPLSNDILVVGNELDHKALRPTLQVLADAFPFNRIIAFGARDEGALPHVVAIPSGRLHDEELHRLIATAKVIVYPTYYEGFGLPVVEGLAYGRPVVVRRSPLWSEVVELLRLPGTLVEFDDPPSLVETVARILAGVSIKPPHTSAQAAEDVPSPSWADCARRLMQVLDECASRADGARWLEREDALRVAGLS